MAGCMAHTWRMHGSMHDSTWAGEGGRGSLAVVVGCVEEGRGCPAPTMVKAASPPATAPPTMALAAPPPPTMAKAAQSPPYTHTHLVSPVHLSAQASAPLGDVHGEGDVAAHSDKDDDGDSRVKSLQMRGVQVEVQGTGRCRCRCRVQAGAGGGAGCRVQACTAPVPERWMPPAHQTAAAGWRRAPWTARSALRWCHGPLGASPGTHAHTQVTKTQAGD